MKSNLSLIPIKNSSELLESQLLIIGQSSRISFNLVLASLATYFGSPYAAQLWRFCLGLWVRIAIIKQLILLLDWSGLKCIEGENFSSTLWLCVLAFLLFSFPRNFWDSFEFLSLCFMVQPYVWCTVHLGKALYAIVLAQDAFSGTSSPF